MNIFNKLLESLEEVESEFYGDLEKATTEKFGKTRPEDLKKWFESHPSQKSNWKAEKKARINHSNAIDSITIKDQRELQKNLETALQQNRQTHKVISRIIWNYIKTSVRRTETVDSKFMEALYDSELLTTEGKKDFDAIKKDKEAKNRKTKNKMSEEDLERDIQLSFYNLILHENPSMHGPIVLSKVFMKCLDSANKTGDLLDKEFMYSVMNQVYIEDDRSFVDDELLFDKAEKIMSRNPNMSVEKAYDMARESLHIDHKD